MGWERCHRFLRLEGGQTAYKNGHYKQCWSSLYVLATLSKDVFERHTSTESEAFSLFICLDAKKFVLLSFFALVKTIYRNVWTKPLPNDAKSPLPVDVHRSKTLLLNLPFIDNNKELVMPNTVAQNVGQSNFCFWMKHDQRYSGKKETMTQTLAKHDLCSLSRKYF